MGHRKYSAPRRGSLAYLPRGRASHWTPRIRYWPEYEGPPRLLAFAGFKAGTTHVTVVDNRQGSLNYGKEVTFPATVVETPPLKVTALRFYETLNGGLQTVGEVWSNDQTKDLQRRIKMPEKFDDVKAWEKIGPSTNKVSEVRVMVSSQPRSTTIGRKIPDLFEVKIDGGTVREKDPRKGDQGFGGLQRGRGGRRNFDHERKGNPRPSEEMGYKETQTQVEKNGQRGRIDWSMAPT